MLEHPSLTKSFLPLQVVTAFTHTWLAGFHLEHQFSYMRWVVCFLVGCSFHFPIAWCLLWSRISRGIEMCVSWTVRLKIRSTRWRKYLPFLGYESSGSDLRYTFEFHGWIRQCTWLSDLEPLLDCTIKYDQATVVTMKIPIDDRAIPYARNPDGLFGQQCTNHPSKLPHRHICVWAN